MSQIKNKFIESATGSNITGVTDQNIRLRNDQPLRARNAANTADINVMKVNASDIIEMQGNLSLNSNKITNLADPTNPQDAATRAYVLANAGTGTVTSVALSAPSIFSVSGSPVTSSGTLTLSYSGTALPIANGGTNSTALLNNNRLMISSGGSIVEAGSITSARALISDANGIPAASVTNSTELGYLAGTTSSVQTQLDGKSNTALSNLASVAINSSLLPGTDNSIDMGSASKRFANSHTLSNVIYGSTSGTITINAADTTTSYSVKMPSAQGGASTVLQNDGAGNLSWATLSTGANQALSNLASVAINTSLLPGATNSINLGSTSLRWANIIAGGEIVNYNGTNDASIALNPNLTSPSGTTNMRGIYAANITGSSEPLLVMTTNNSTANSTATGQVRIDAGNKTAGTGDSGSISIFTGTSAGGNRGDIILASRNIQLNAANTISANSVRITDVGSPTSSGDAATKFYVDSVAQGLKPKQAVRVATIANISLSSAPSSIDGITLSSGNRVLVKNQTLSENNGIYQFNGTGNAMTRTTDFDSLTPIDEINGAYMFVQEGTSAGIGYVQQGTVTTLGTDPIVFVTFSSTTTVFGGDMITVTGGDTISVDLASTSGLESTNPGNAAGQLRAKVDSTTIKINGSNALETLKQTEQLITLNSTDITNQYVDLSFAVYGTSASSNSVQLTVIGGPLQQKTVDYTVSLTGGSGGVTRITFAGGLATGGASELVSGDILAVSYSYLT